MGACNETPLALVEKRQATENYDDGRLLRSEVAANTSKFMINVAVRGDRDKNSGAGPLFCRYDDQAPQNRSFFELKF